MQIHLHLSCVTQLSMFQASFINIAGVHGLHFYSALQTSSEMMNLDRLRLDVSAWITPLTYHLDNQCTGNGEMNAEYFVLDHMACKNKLLLI